MKSSIYSELKELRARFAAKQVPASEVRTILTEELGWTDASSNRFEHGIRSIDPRITHACDHECPHCWANLYGKHMKMEVFEEVLNVAQSSQIGHVQFTGGEPTLNPALPYMAEAAKERGLYTILRTHGRHLGRTIRQGENKTLAQMLAPLFDEVVVSIDGTSISNFHMRPTVSMFKLLDSDRGHGTAAEVRSAAKKQFNETVNGLEAMGHAASQTGTKIIVNTVVGQPNARDLHLLGGFLSSRVRDNTIKVDRWDITQVFPSPESQDPQTYVISDDAFLKSVALASVVSTNLQKRAKPVTYPRCLIVDESGRTYIGGDSIIELGTLTRQNSQQIIDKVGLYSLQTELEAQREKRYLLYNP